VVVVVVVGTAERGAADLVANPLVVGAFWKTATTGGCPFTPVDGWGGRAPRPLKPSPAPGPAVEGPVAAFPEYTLVPPMGAPVVCPL